MAKRDELALSQMVIRTYVLTTVGRMTAYNKALSNAIFNMKACRWQTPFAVVETLHEIFIARVQTIDASAPVATALKALPGSMKSVYRHVHNWDNIMY